MVRAPLLALDDAVVLTVKKSDEVIVAFIIVFVETKLLFVIFITFRVVVLFLIILILAFPVDGAVPTEKYAERSVIFAAA